MAKIGYWVYILRCVNGSYYTGYTNNLTRRYQEHISGSGKCKYTRSFKPLNMAQSWQIHGDKASAMKVEQFIKKLSRQEKEQLLLFPDRLASLFNCEPYDWQQVSQVGEGINPVKILTKNKN